MISLHFGPTGFEIPFLDGSSAGYEVRIPKWNLTTLANFSSNALVKQGVAVSPSTLKPSQVRLNLIGQEPMAMGSALNPPRSSLCSI